MTRKIQNWISTACIREEDNKDDTTVAGDNPEEETVTEGLLKQKKIAQCQKLPKDIII